MKETETTQNNEYMRYEETIKKIISNGLCGGVTGIFIARDLIKEIERIEEQQR